MVVLRVHVEDLDAVWEVDAGPGRHQDAGEGGERGGVRRQGGVPRRVEQLQVLVGPDDEHVVALGDLGHEPAIGDPHAVAERLQGDHPVLERGPVAAFLAERLLRQDEVEAVEAGVGDGGLGHRQVGHGGRVERPRIAADGHRTMVHTAEMGRRYERIDDTLRRWLEDQHLFFVATAPLAGDGHVNVSPRGLDTFRILDDCTVAWLDLTGSGVETIAHLRENGRITMMFSAFEGPPRIVRLAGRGEVLPTDHELAALFPEFVSARAVIRVALDRIWDSCGFGVPVYRYEGERTTLQESAARRGPEGLLAYRAEKNRVSIDGLPGLDADG